MRYGNPSIAAAFDRLRAAAVDRIVVLPLFPQYASSSTGTGVARVMELASADWNVPWLDVVPPFYDEPMFLDAFTAVARPKLAEARPDHVLFSFHGLPERHVQKSDKTAAHCLRSAGCCATIGEANRNCYRAQCFATARALTARLGLADDGYTVCFQSRLGKTPWIEPHTDHLIDELARAGKKRLAVLCPAFVADCLETIEEIGMRAREQFRAAGGEELTLVPSLNATSPWIDAVVELARRHGPRTTAAMSPS
jgi:ferrochelatase